MAPACYTNRLSVRPGERFTLHASASGGPCRLTITRIGGADEVVLVREGLSIGEQPTPEHADRDGCGWAASAEIEVGAGWRSGYYDIALTDAAGETAHHFVCVKPSQPGSTAAFVLATNTYHAYNWWGGANAYADVAGLMSRRLTLPQAMEGAIGTLSTERPFAPLIVAAPADTPRLVNLRPRGYLEPPWAVDRAWAKAHRPSPYDRSAGFLNKWEHVFLRWAERAGYFFDLLTDHDLDCEPEALADYTSAFFVGHSEYWSGPQRDQVERFVDAGGKLAILSGNTCFWKVRWEDAGRRLISHKWRGFEAETVPAAEATHLWSHPAFGRPEAALTGLSFLFGGYHRLGLCAARGQGGFAIYDDRHWALAGSDLFYGDVLGADLPLIGYENDGCRFEFGRDGLPKATPMLGVPASLEIIGLAPCAFGEAADSGYRPLIPPEKLDVVAEVMFGSADAAAQAAVLRGHAVMASFRRGKGEVFNAGTTEWAHGLADPFVAKITHNVVSRFGVTRRAP